MTNWTPDLDTQPGPRYRAIAEALAEDVRRGALPAGTRLPTHRDLAWRLKVTVGTVSRAYAEAERRGLIAGEVGRGTFVRAAAVSPPVFHLDHSENDDFVDLSVHRPRAASEASLLAGALAISPPIPPSPRSWSTSRMPEGRRSGRRAPPGSRAAARLPRRRSRWW